MADSNREVYREIRSKAIDRYESGRWDRDAAIDLLRHAHMTYLVEAPDEQIVRGYRDHEDIEYCPFCGSDSIEFTGWLPHDDEPDRPTEWRFDCDNCGGFSVDGDVVGAERYVVLPRALCTSPTQWYSR